MKYLKSGLKIGLVFLMIGFAFFLCFVGCGYFFQFVESAHGLTKSFIESPLNSKNLALAWDFLLKFGKVSIAFLLFWLDAMGIFILAED